MSEIKKIEWEQVKGIIRLILSHHPLCGYYDDHTFNIKGVHLCKGCSMGYPGIVVGLIWGFFHYPSLLTVNIFLFVNLIYFFIVELVELYEPIKLLSRFLTGVCAGAMIYLIFTETFWIRVILIIIFVTLANVITYFRHLSLKKTCAYYCGISYDDCDQILPVSTKEKFEHNEQHKQNRQEPIEKTINEMEL